MTVAQPEHYERCERKTGQDREVGEEQPFGEYRALTFVRTDIVPMRSGWSVQRDPAQRVHAGNPFR